MPSAWPTPPPALSAKFRQLARQVPVPKTSSTTQVGIRLEPFIQFATAPAAVITGTIQTSNRPVIDRSELTADEEALLNAGFNSTDPRDLEVYYVSQAWHVDRNDPDKNIFTAGRAFPRSFYHRIGIPDFNDSILIPDSNTIYSLPHEAMHIFSGSHLHPGGPFGFGRNNLMVRTSSPAVEESQATATDAKRLNENPQQRDIYESEYPRSR